MGGQEHFYFETQSLIVVPKKEDDEMEIYSSTQNPTEIQVGDFRIFTVYFKFTLTPFPTAFMCPSLRDTTA